MQRGWREYWCILCSFLFFIFFVMYYCSSYQYLSMLFNLSACRGKTTWMRCCRYYYYEVRNRPFCIVASVWRKCTEGPVPAPKSNWKLCFDAEQQEHLWGNLKLPCSIFKVGPLHKYAYACLSPAKNLSSFMH